MQNGHPKKLGWLERAITTHNYHVDKVKKFDRWTIRDTADDLNRSLGSVSEDLLIVSWMKSHESQLRKFRYAKDAIAYIRTCKKKMIEPFSL